MKINEVKIEALREALRERDSESFDLGASVRGAILEVGESIWELRNEAGLTQAQVADRVGMSQADVARVENARGVRGPTVAMLERIAAAFGKRLVIRFESVHKQERKRLHSSK